MPLFRYTIPMWNYIHEIILCRFCLIDYPDYILPVLFLGRPSTGWKHTRYLQACSYEGVSRVRFCLKSRLGKPKKPELDLGIRASCIYSILSLSFGSLCRWQASRNILLDLKQEEEERKILWKVRFFSVWGKISFLPPPPPPLPFCMTKSPRLKQASTAWVGCPMHPTTSTTGKVNI